MDPLDVVALTRELVDIESTTGREGACGAVIAARLRDRGWTVTEQRVTEGRGNVVATRGPRPALAFSTHFDCVPPFFPSRVEGDRIYGRGTCDAKGILVAQWAAAERLLDEGRDDIALVFVVGEERGSDGAMAANREALPTRFLVNGEPTECRLGAATRGAWRVRFRTTGKAVHSSHPHLGVSAIEKLIDALVQVRTIVLPEDPLLGRTSYTVGVIQGGVAPNVVPPHASCEVMFRTVGAASDIAARLVPLEALVEIEHVLEVPPVRLHVVPGLETEVFAYTTDVPLLGGFGTPLLYGPGSILDAHTDTEHVRIPDLHRAVADYVSLAHTLLR
jgi:acetylornithine deacetylase